MNKKYYLLTEGKCCGFMDCYIQGFNTLEEVIEAVEGMSEWIYDEVYTIVEA